jgi:hypothetical protein
MKYEFDPEANRRVHVILVVMLITLAILCFCAKASNGAEPLPQPVNLKCTELTGHIQETRVCATAKKSIEKHKRLRLYEQDRDEWFVWYIVNTAFNERIGDADRETIFVSINTLICIPTFEGICMGVWNNAFVTDPHDVNADMRQEIDNTVKVYDWFLEQALPVLDKMRFEPCPDPYNKPPSEILHDKSRAK